MLSENHVNGGTPAADLSGTAASSPAEYAGAAPGSASEPRIEAVLFSAGLLTPDQLGELAHAHATTGRPIEELVLERGIVDLTTMRALAGGASGSPTTVAHEPPAPEAAAPVAPATAQPEPPAAVQPEAVAPVQLEPTVLSDGATVTTLPVVRAASEPAPDVPAGAPAPVLPPIGPAAAPEPQPTAASVVAERVVLWPAHEELESHSRAGISYAVAARLGSGHLLDVGRYADEPSAFEASRRLLAELSGGREWVQIGPMFVRPSAVVSLELHARLVGDTA